MFFFGALLYGIFLGLFSHYLYCVHSKTNSSFANQHTQSYDPQKVRNAQYFIGHLMNFTQRSILYCFHTICSRLSDSRDDAKMKGKRKYQRVTWEKRTVAGKRKGATIDLILDIRYLCTRFRIGGIKVMSRGISGANKRGNLPMREVALDFVYSLKT